MQRQKKGKSSQPVVNQEKSNEIQTAGENVKQDEVPSEKAQVAPSTETNVPSLPQAVSKPQESPSVENKKPVPLQASSKSKVSQEEKVVTKSEQPAVVLVSVPDLTGTQLNVAKSILSLRGLSVGSVSTIPDPPNDGMVVRQIPKPGTQLKKGSTINLILGSK